MRKQAYTLIATVILAGFVATSSAQAQSLSTGKLVANIPFEFNVGSQTLPAGEYTVRNIAQAAANQVLQLRSRDGKVSAIVQTRGVISGTQESSKLVFQRSGDRYYFAQAWMQGDRNGLGTARPRAEREMSESLARMPKTRTVALMARR
jgi:hypothetical protein